MTILNLANKEILKLLKEHGTTNINTISLENGYSTTAYTRRYDSIESNGKKMILIMLCVIILRVIILLLEHLK